MRAYHRGNIIQVDIPGLRIVRGENVVFMGDIDETIETEGLTEVSNEEIKREREAEKAADKFKGEMLTHGFRGLKGEFMARLLAEYPPIRPRFPRTATLVPRVGE